MKPRYTVEQSEKSELFHVVRWGTPTSGRIFFSSGQMGNSIACFDTVEEAVDYMQCCYYDDICELQDAEVLK